MVHHFLCTNPYKMSIFERSVTRSFFSGIVLTYWQELREESEEGEGGKDSLIKVDTDVRRVQNLGRAKFPQKNLMPRQKSAQKPNDWEGFHELQSAKIGNFQQVGHIFHSFNEYYTFFFIKNCQKPNAREKFTSQNLMPGKIWPLKYLMPGPAHPYLPLSGSRPRPPQRKIWGYVSRQNSKQGNFLKTK